METKLDKKYSLLTAICMVVGIVVGSGVFFKAQTILNNTEGNLSLGILAWIIGGAIMIACILAFAIMATKYEKVNGIVDYAEATVGDKYAYIVGWFMTFIYYPTLTSVLAWLSARYTITFIVSAFPDFALAVPVEQGGAVLGPEVMAFTVFYLCAAYTVNAISPKLAGYFQISTTFIKLIPLVLMAIVGIIVGLTSDQQVLAENFAYNSKVTGGTLFAAVVATAFAYEGWIIATAINAELKNAKKNLPIALVAGGIIIIVIYIAYYVGVAGGASVETLMKDGATKAFTGIFGTVFGTILNVFVAVSCMGTMNGLMLGCTRGLYSIAVRGHGPRPDVYSVVDEKTNMTSNSAIVGLMLCGAWFLFFYVANLAPTNWLGVFGFDSSELPIVSLYALYIPIFIMFMAKAKDLNVVKRFIVPALAIIGSLFMVFAAVYAHGITPYQNAAEDSKFACPILFYLIIFAVITIIGLFFYKKTAVKEVKE